MREKLIIPLSLSPIPPVDKYASNIKEKNTAQWNQFFSCKEIY